MRKDMTHRVSIMALVLLATALLGAPEGAHAALGEFPEDPGNLEVFGYSIATDNTNTRVQYLRETAKFSNVVAVRGWSSDFAEIMLEAKKNGQKAIVSLHLTLFKEAVPNSPENDWVLRDDYVQSFLGFVADHRQLLGSDMVAAFYPADEPYWNGIGEKDYTAANQLIKKVFSSIPTYVSLSIRDAEIVEGILDSLTIQGGLSNPIPNDWVGYHHYGILDPATDSSYQANLAIVKSHMKPRSQFFYVIDGYWSAGVHGANGIEQSEMDQVARNYYEIARADPDAIGLGVFIWDAFASHVLGTRDLPENVLREHIRIGAAISGKCGIPDDIPPLEGSTVEWFRQCRFYTSVEWTDPLGQSDSGQIADFGTDESGLFWFFNAENLEFLVKVLDGCSINGHFWVFASAATDVGYELSVTDAATGDRRVYTNPLGTLAPAIGDTAAFATCAIPSEPLGPDHGIPMEWTAGEGCVPSATRHCLRQGRFEVVVDWADFVGQTGPGSVVPYGTDESGLFWFFSEDNWEMLVSVLDGCSINERYWVFAAATTTVGYDLTVTDTTTGEARTYHNPLGQLADAIGDTDAFATCP